MTKKKRKPLNDFEKLEVKETIANMMECDFETIDKSIMAVGKQVIDAYTYWLMTEEQRKRLSDYKERRRDKNIQRDEARTDERIKEIESYPEPPQLYHVWKVDWRVIVASTRTVMSWKDEREVANGGIILEIYRDKTPKAYDYVKKFQIKNKD